MQAVWILLTAYPVYLVNCTPMAKLAKLGLIDFLGFSLWSSGFIFEVVADMQKISWQNRLGEQERKKQFINEGLWTLSRHPNYFGEVMLWCGSFIMCASGMRGTAASVSMLISPLFVTGLLYKVSGVPLLEKSSDQRFGHLAEYQEYKRQTPEFIPKFPFSKSKTD